MSSYLRKYKIIRILLIAVFIYFGLASAFVGFVAFFPDRSVGLHHSVTTIIALIIFALCCFTSAYGLIRRRPFGIHIGFIVPAGLILMFLGEIFTHWNRMGNFNFEDILWSALFLSTPILSFIGLEQLRKNGTRTHQKNQNTTA